MGTQLLTGKTVFITGGATGIGFACARRVVDEGGSAFIVGRRADVVRDAVAALGSSAGGLDCDVTQQDQVDRGVAAAAERFGPLDGAVNSAGFGMSGSILATPPDVFNGVVTANLGGTYNAIRSEAASMRTAGGGAIVNISSLAGQRVSRWQSAYCAAKAAMDALTTSAADELGDHGIRVNAVLPGLVRTEMAAAVADSDIGRDRFVPRIPLGRLGDPQDVAALVTFLLSDGASWLTGQCIAIDGGQSLRGLPDLGDVYRQFLPDLFLDDEGLVDPHDSMVATTSAGRDPR
jgi:NAD(P)-dependent dehydrogenase (short-subunit alcohol dehydrogenase family)